METYDRICDQKRTCGGIRTLASSVASHSLSGRTNPGGGSQLRVSASRADTFPEQVFMHTVACHIARLQELVHLS